MKTVVAILDTMWGWCGAERQATPYFIINPKNASGRRLYQFTKGAQLFVTNSCKELGKTANDHGVPDPIWLQSNLDLLNNKYGIDILLICGKVAQKTYIKTDHYFNHGKTEIKFMMHPVARTWSRAKLDIEEAEIQELIHG